MDALTRTWFGRYADAAFALAIGVLIAVATALNTARSDDVALAIAPWLGWALIVLASGALALRRRHPVPVLLVVTAACAVYYPMTEPDGPLMITLVIALYTAAAQGRLVAAVLVTAVTMAVVVYGEVRSPVDHLASIAPWLLAGWFVAVVAVGAVVHNRRAYQREAERRALAAEHGREEEARRRATEERLRIAREMHDALGHNISLINIQASAALHGGDPGERSAALEEIKRASKDALRELRATLGVLRQVDVPGEAAAPAGLGRLRELADRTAAAGLRVRTETEGDPRPLRAEVDLAVYRIAQEALTNITRHSDATSALVRVRYGPSDLLVEITDDGHPVRGEPMPGSGSGIPGMRDRAEALGGTLEAGPAATGFRVRARLPLRADA